MNTREPLSVDPGEGTPADPDSAAERPGSGDSEALFRWLLAHPTRLDAAALLWGDGRLVSDAEPACRTAIGWHRDGGAIVLGVTAEDDVDELLLETFALAAATAAWPSERWDLVVGRWWETAEPNLRETVAARWGLEADADLEARRWSRAAWGSDPGPGPTRVGIVAVGVPSRLRRGVGWLADSGTPVAAWEASPHGSAFRLVAAAGRWEPGAWRPLPGEVVEERSAVTPERALEELEDLAGRVGAEVVHRGPEWTKIEGHRSLRIFPGPGRLDVQLVGADEGTRVGLQHRFGVTLAASKWEKGPPGAHLTIDLEDGMARSTERLLEAWLLAPDGSEPKETTAQGEG